ncbi:MAG: bifunctional adenosylcobinamide kinase/adenosylcobinamide-phosphate guanylyltransferase [Deltaproteobacteria bacterium]|nr:bifunctional adenosylcobinamide kinase/adenosylcobinamide-phosphate guanylyltransferase [Deltaproteobacteria bacterium]
MAGNVTLITGGARSGKSAFALELAGETGRRVYLATAEAKDDEMGDRIARHRRERGPGWKTVEEPLKLAAATKRLDGAADAVVVDCLTLWLSNLLGARMKLDVACESVLKALSARRTATRFILVSNEVGMGIVPDKPMARDFRDAAGKLNQRVAALADEVYLMVAGIPINIKPTCNPPT